MVVARVSEVGSHDPSAVESSEVREVDKMDDNLQRAINAINAGDKRTGQRLLAQVIGANPEDEIAWMWLSAVVDDDQRRFCLQQVLKLDPTNAAAQRGLLLLDESGSARLPMGFLPDSLATEVGESSTTVTKKCPFCAEYIKTEAVRCRYCGADLAKTEANPIQEAIVNHSAGTSSSWNLSPQQRSNILNKAVSAEIQRGWTLSNRTDTNAQLTKKKKFSCLLFVLLGFLPYVLWYGLVDRDRQILVEVDDNGRLLWDGVPGPAAPTPKDNATTILFLAILIGVIIMVCLCMR
jgi:hypothetical protein